MLEDANKSGLSYGYDDPDPPLFHEGKLSEDFNKERKMKHDYKLHKYSHHHKDDLKCGYKHKGKKQGRWVEVYKHTIEFNRWKDNLLSGTCVTLHIDGGKTITEYKNGYKRSIKFYGPEEW
jgi:hypothetical protein